MKSIRSYRLAAIFVISLCGYGMIGYGVDRSNFAVLISLFGALFLCYYAAVRWVDTSRKLAWAIGAAVCFRLILLFALPSLSDDFYRFIWDGNLLAHGLNPFSHTPQFYVENGLPDFLTTELFTKMNSQNYYTVYPPISQFVYALSAGLSGTHLLGNVVVMKVIMLASEMGTLWVIKKLLHHFERSAKWLLIYALNPLIVLELTGNIHFEGVMIFFLLSAYYCWLKEKWWLAAACFVLAVNTKLLPLILMPYLVFSLGWKRSAGLIGVTIAGTILLHIPFLDAAFIHNLSNSLGLYFQSFEFNASIYYLVRWAGFRVEGYNIIQTAAPRLALVATGIIISVSWIFRRKTLRNLPLVYIIAFTVYFLFSTTVHPWYISSLVAFVPLAGLVYPVVWSALIPLTYITYTTPAYNENLWLVALEYILILTAVGYDFYHRKKDSRTKNQRIFRFVHSFKE